MVVGPQEAEMAIDTLEGIVSFYPTADLWVREDRTTDGTWDKLSQWAEGKPVQLSRNRIAQGLDGLSKSIADLLQAIALAEAVPEIVIKIDPDAILLRRGLVEVFREKLAQNGPGICGSYQIAPDGGARDTSAHRRPMLLDLLPVGKGHQRSFRTRPVFYWSYLLRAIGHGYSPGEHVQGGLYAVDGRTLLALECAGYFRAVPESHQAYMRCEDVLLSMAARSLGHRLISVNDYPERVVAWVRAARPLGITPEQAWERNYLAVHPVKKGDGDIRQFFRDKRLIG